MVLASCPNSQSTSSTPYLRPDQTPNSSLTLNFTNSGTWGPPPLGPAEFYNLDYYRKTVPNSEQTLPTAKLQYLHAR